MDIDYGILLGIIMLMIIGGIKLSNYKILTHDNTEFWNLSNEISPVEAGFIMHGGNCSSYELLVLIYEWIHKGWISLGYVNDMAILTRETDIDEHAPLYEKNFFYYLFPDQFTVRYSVELKEDLKKNLIHYIKGANQYYKHKYMSNTKFQNMMKFMLYFLAVLPLIITIILKGNDYGGIDVVLNMSVIALILFLIPIFISILIHTNTLKRIINDKMSCLLVLFLVIILLGSVLLYVSIKNINAISLIRLFIFPFILSSLNIMLLSSLPLYSKKLRNQREKVLKFRKYLIHSDYSHIDMQNKIHSIFTHNLLSYVLVLDILPIESQEFLTLMKEDVNIETMQLTLDIIELFTRDFL